MRMTWKISSIVSTVTARILFQVLFSPFVYCMLKFLCRGHSLDWYNQVYGQMCTVFARRIRDSFKGGIKMNEGPETKV